MGLGASTTPVGPANIWREQGLGPVSPDFLPRLCDLEINDWCCTRTVWNRRSSREPSRRPGSISCRMSFTTSGALKARRLTLLVRGVAPAGRGVVSDF